MSLEVHRITDPADLAEFAQIQIAAFTGGGGMTGLLTPNPMPADYLQKATEKHTKSWRDEPDVTYLKVIDPALGGKMIAGAKWRINKKERTEEEIQGMLPVPGPDEEGRPAAQDFMNYLHRVRKDYMGTKPFYFLHILATHPDHHRRGAGGLLLDWGCKQTDADEVPLPAFLESTLIGRPLYERYGFREVYQEVFDLTKYGLEGTDTSTVMIRQPQARAT